MAFYFVSGTDRACDGVVRELLNSIDAVPSRLILGAAA